MAKRLDNMTIQNLANDFSNIMSPAKQITPYQKAMAFVESIKSLISSNPHNLDFIRYILADIAENLVSEAFTYKQGTNLTV